MVQQLDPWLAFEPWTWEEDICKYQTRVMQENQLWERLEKTMTPEEEKVYNLHIERNAREKVANTMYDWAHWIMEHGKKTLGLAKHMELVPVPPWSIKEPDMRCVDKNYVEIRPKWGISNIEDSSTAMYYLMKSQNRSPGESRDRSREGGHLLSKLGATNEYIHPAVWWRAKQLKYNSKALSGFERVQDPTYQSWGYYKKSTKVWIPEWFMIPSNESLGNTNDFEAIRLTGDQGRENWQHAEWTYTENVEGTEEMQRNLVKFYVQIKQAEQKMIAAKKKFPFEVPLW